MSVQKDSSKAARRPRPVHYLEYAGWLAMSAFFKFLPRRLTVWLADGLGLFFFHVLRMRRRVVEENLAIAFCARTAEERRRIAARTYQNSVLTLIEFVQPDPFFRDTSRIASVHGFEHFEKVRASGAIILTGHIGNWEALPAYAQEQGIGLTTLIKLLHNPLVNADVLRRRSHYDMEVLPTNASMKSAISAVRRGRWLVFLSDQDARRQGIFVDFFGRPASTAPGLAYFAWKLNQPVLPVFCTREHSAKRGLVVHFFPPIYPDSTGEREEELKRLTEAHVRALEQIVERHPEDYFWFHRRWKTRQKKVQRSTFSV